MSGRALLRAGFVCGLIGIAAGVWLTLAERDLHGLLGVALGVACIAIVLSERPEA